MRINLEINLESSLIIININIRYVLLRTYFRIDSVAIL